MAYSKTGRKSQTTVHLRPGEQLWIFIGADGAGKKVNNSQRGQGKACADIVIWKSKKDKDDKKAAFIVVECKAENVKIRVEDYYQGFNYAAWAHADFLSPQMKRRQNSLTLLLRFSRKSWKRLLLFLRLKISIMPKRLNR